MDKSQGDGAPEVGSELRARAFSARLRPAIETVAGSCWQRSSLGVRTPEAAHGAPEARRSTVAIRWPSSRSTRLPEQRSTLDRHVRLRGPPSGRLGARRGPRGRILSVSFLPFASPASGGRRAKELACPAPTATALRPRPPPRLSPRQC